MMGLPDIRSVEDHVQLYTLDVPGEFGTRAGRVCESLACGRWYISAALNIEHSPCKNAESPVAPFNTIRVDRTHLRCQCISTALSCTALSRAVLHSTVYLYCHSLAAFASVVLAVHSTTPIGSPYLNLPLTSCLPTRVSPQGIQIKAQTLAITHVLRETLV
jgi:hypothetical protein